MVNTVILTGHYVSLKKNTMTISITITNNNVDPYDILIPTIINNSLLKYVKEYIANGDIVGIKGYLDIKDNHLICIVEKITFLSSKKD